MSTQTYYRCWNCDWQPDPKRRKGAWEQVEEHTNQAGHPCEMRTVPADAPNPFTDEGSDPTEVSESSPP